LRTAVKFVANPFKGCKVTIVAQTFLSQLEDGLG